MWCIKSPRGRLIQATLGRTKEDSLWKLFNVMPDSFQTKYWKKLEESRRAYKQLGYRAVRVEIKEAK